MSVVQNQELLWKQKYQALLQDLQAKERQWKDLEGVLRLTATSLILAADRRDEVLNRQLEDLRLALRNDHSGTSLRSSLSEISQGVARIAQSRAQDESTPGSESEKILKKLVSELPLPRPLLKKKRLLVESIDNANPQDGPDSIVQQFVALVRDLLDHEAKQACSPTAGDPIQTTEIGHTAIKDVGSDSAVTDGDQNQISGIKDFLVGVTDDLLAPSAGSRAGRSLKKHLTAFYNSENLDEMRLTLLTLLRKSSTVLGDGGSTERSDVPEGIGGLLAELLDRLEFPPELIRQALLLKKQLEGSADWPEIKAAVADIADLVTEARMVVQREKEDIENFLSALTSQLVGLDRYLASTSELKDQARQRREALDHTLSAHFSEMAQSMDGTTDLGTIKATISDKLNHIQERLQQHRIQEQEHEREEQAEFRRLEKRLKYLEKETNELRARIRLQKDEARQDALTKLPNRMAYDERIDQEFARWARFQNPVSLAVLDVDHFKKINDTYGHKTGDRVLKRLGALFSSRVRKVDFIARYGGEEFVILMPETTASNGLFVVEKLRRAVAACRFHYKESEVPVTVSCGVTEMRNGDTPESVFERADQALYRAKADGRNCSVSAD